VTTIGKWAQSNVGTIAAWIGMVLTMVVGTASQWTMLEAQHAQASERLDRVETAAEQHTAEIVKLNSDVRSITEAHDRLDVAVTRQEAATRQIDRLTVELRAVVNTLGARQ
jgi:autotransporter translocation and assembly factor TamB|tara:strand:+ start:1028 stop:1360 length:333 start_codon:yes stop_codon:yes gene_type:complete